MLLNILEVCHVVRIVGGQHAIWVVLINIESTERRIFEECTWRCSFHTMSPYSITTSVLFCCLIVRRFTFLHLLQGYLTWLRPLANNTWSYEYRLGRIYSLLLLCYRYGIFDHWIRQGVSSRIDVKVLELLVHLLEVILRVVGIVLWYFILFGNWPSPHIVSLTTKLPDNQLWIPICVWSRMDLFAVLALSNSQLLVLISSSEVNLLSCYLNWVRSTLACSKWLGHNRLHVVIWTVETVYACLLGWSCSWWVPRGAIYKWPTMCLTHLALI